MGERGGGGVLFCVVFVNLLNCCVQFIVVLVTYVQDTLELMLGAFLVWSLLICETVASVYCGIGDVQDTLALMLSAFLCGL